MLALSRSDLKTLVPMSDAVELMKVAFRELSAGRPRRRCGRWCRSTTTHRRC